MASTGSIEGQLGGAGSTTATSTRCGASTARRPTIPRTWISARSRRPPRLNWFDAYSPTTLKQYAGFGDVTYALTDALKVDVGARVNHYDYRFSSCLSGWGSANGAATPSCSGLIPLSSTSFNPKFNLSYTFSPDVMAYATVSTGFRPGGGNAAYPTTGAAWGAAFQQQSYTSGKWPSTYEPDRVVSYELGEKARLLDRRLTVNASVYYEDWRHVQLEAYPNDWALNINGNYVSIYGPTSTCSPTWGRDFSVEIAAGYLYEWLEGGPHWVIAPVHKMPEVAPVSGTVALSYSRPLGGSYAFTARLEDSYTGARYSIFFSNPYEFTGTYRQLPGYNLVNVARRGKMSRFVERHIVRQQPHEQARAAGEHVHGK